MPPPTLGDVLGRLTGDWPDLQWQVGRGRDGGLVLQISIQDGDEDPLQAPRGGAGEPAPDPADPPGDGAAPEEEPRVEPREVPASGADLPQAVHRLAVRLPTVAGRLDPLGRLLRAANAGAGDRRVYNGDQAYPNSLERLNLSTRVYIALRGQDGTGPWLCRHRTAYAACVGEPFAEVSVSRAFASEAEGIAYCWGAGLGAELPPQWA